MTTFILDTLAYSDTLKAGGFTEQQATTQARALAEILGRLEAKMAALAERGNSLRHAIREPELMPDTHIREPALKRTAIIVETNTALKRWIIGAAVLQTTVIVGVLMKVAKLI